MFSYYYSKIIKRLRGKSIRNSQITKSARVGTGCNVVDTTMGRYSYCGHDCQIVSIDIGSFCSISDHVFIGGAEHPISWVSTSPVFQNMRHSGPNKRFAKFDLLAPKHTTVGSDVWIGHGVTIKQGVVVGHGAVIGSNALVTKDVPPYAIVGGVPAKVIKFRFEKHVIDALLDSKWWLLKDSDIQEIAPMIKNPEQFLLQIDKNNKRSKLKD